MMGKEHSRQRKWQLLRPWGGTHPRLSGSGAVEAVDEYEEKGLVGEEARKSLADMEIIFRSLTFLLYKGKVLGVSWAEEWFDLSFQNFLKLQLFESRLSEASVEAEIGIVMMVATEGGRFWVYFESRLAHFENRMYKREYPP